MKTIVAVTDFSQRSGVALRRAAAIAAGAGARLLLVHAVDDGLPRHILDHRVAEAEQTIDQEAATVGGVNVSCEVVVGDVFWALHRAATQAHADLIVAGDHRRSPLRDLFRDTTVERLIRVSAVPVLIVRIDGAPYRHALVGVESDEGPELLHVLARFGTAAPGRATLLHAVSAPAEGLLHYAGVEREIRDDYRARIAQEARARITAGLKGHRMPLDIRIVDAPPRLAIADLVESAGCDLVAVSSHARRAVARGLLGSVSSELIRHGSTDVLIVPRIVSRSRGL
ncbi:universal stress protein [Chelatococcus daeguensis]|uniref:UspA domain-containing protein n=1 Tax=Chelatococcus daeguensis TaxID=444444 RepID=A0AAC9P0T0_9HYPH|nr:universal stress protein [Chelatococcus daeguensis]APF39548.1 hypothetical protein BOQ54_18900 [Chelatococcus daeguensis]KZE29089.1 hypothetical protein AVW15_04580 [Chelatococcus daeguensis]MBM3083790.1 universal stress protein [Chelatococcus daeguensis]